MTNFGQVALQRSAAVFRFGQTIPAGKFRLALSATAISAFGSSITMAVLLIKTAEWFGPQGLSSYLLACSLPGLLFGLLAGVIVDRFDRRAVVVVADLARAVASTLLIWSGHDRFTLLLALVVIGASLGSFTAAANAALVPALVPADEMAAAYSASYSATSLARIAGLGLGGVLVSRAVTAAFAIDAATFLIAGFLRAQLGRLKAVTPDGSGASTELKPAHLAAAAAQGLRFIWKTPAVRIGAAIAIVAQLPGAGVNVLLTPYLVDDLRQPGWWLAVIELAGLAGILVMSRFSPQIITRHGPLKSTIYGFSGAVICVGLLGSVHTVAWLVIIDPLAGLSVALLQTAMLTLLSGATPDHIRGRVQATVTTASTTGYLVMTPIVGAVGQRWGARETFAITACAAAALSMAMVVLYSMSAAVRWGKTVAQSIRAGLSHAALTILGARRTVQHPPEPMWDADLKLSYHQHVPLEDPMTSRGAECPVVNPSTARPTAHP